ncbi:MAG: FapA family protein [Planctomycetota bacterium]
MTETDRQISVRISEDALRADLMFDADFARAPDAVEICLAKLVDFGLSTGGEIEAEITGRLEEIRASNEAGPQRLHFEGKPATDGTHGRFEINESLARFDEPDDDDASVDHYSRSNIQTVQPGDVVGRVIPPTDGEDGLDLMARIVPARPGRPVKLDTDESVEIRSDGTVVAVGSGAVRYEPPRLSVSDVLELSGGVDFSTGNIDFRGSATIAHGVKDNFEIKVTGDCTVHGTIDAASVEVGGDLVVGGGVAGKDRAEINVGQSMHARFVGNAAGQVGRDLTVDREIIGSRFTVGRELSIPNGSIFGGEHHVLRRVRVGTLGAENGTKTVIFLGSSPPYRGKVEAAQAELEKVTQRLSEKQQELEQLQAREQSLSASEKEELTEAMFALPELEAHRDKIAELTAELRESYEKLRLPVLRIERALLPGVVICCDDVSADVHTPVKGPVTISLNEHGNLVITDYNGKAQAINQVAKVESDPADEKRQAA